MLKELHITNLVLVEQAIIPFETGFNVITGETGAGKSAVMAALSLIAGERSDLSLIRKGCEKAVLEALFDCKQMPKVLALLEESGVDCSEGCELIIKRELQTNGKGRAFINHQMVQLKLLREVGKELLQIVSQHATHLLFESEAPLYLLDLYGGLEEESATFGRLYSEWKAMTLKKEALQKSEGERLRKMEALKAEIKEIREASIEEGEDEELFAEYTLLANAEERKGKCDAIDELFNDQGILSRLELSVSLAASLATIDPAAKEIAESCKNALLDLRELSYTLSKYQGSIEFHPVKMNQVNERLTLINHIKRKYGNEPEEYYQEASQKLKQLECTDGEVERLEMLIYDHLESINSLGKTLSNKRRQAASELEKALTEELQSLNMERALLEVEVHPSDRNRSGDDAVLWYITPNVGEGRLLLRDSASGGELSRVLLALYTLLAGKAEASTLIFDEIDANIGGKTATIVGKKLKAIGRKQQLFCITHFPQVAEQGDHHIHIAKVEKEGRTETVVTPLSGNNKAQELARMAGR